MKRKGQWKKKTIREKIIDLADLPLLKISGQLKTSPKYVRKVLAAERIPATEPPRKRDEILKLKDLPIDQICEQTKSSRMYVYAVLRTKKQKAKTGYFEHDPYYQF